MKFILAIVVIRFLIALVTETIKNRKEKTIEEKGKTTAGVKHPAEFELRWE